MNQSPDRKRGKISVKTRLVLTVSATFTMIVILELVMRVTYPSYANYNTEMWRYASILKKLSRTPFLGHEHRPNRTATLYGATIRTNSLGLRADRDYPIPKPNHVKRTLVVGDSITLGWGVEYEDTYPKILELKLNNKAGPTHEVVNLGVGNYNTVNELASLKKHLDLEPDLVVCGFYINDIEKVTYPSALQYFLMSHSYLYGFASDRLINLNYRKTKSYRSFYNSQFADAQLTRRLNSALNGMIELTKKKNIPFILINIPEFHQFKPYPFPQVQKFIESIAYANPDVAYIDLLTRLRDEDPTRLWVTREDHHPNALGQELIASAIFEKLIEVGYLDMSKEQPIHLP